MHELGILAALGTSICWVISSLCFSKASSLLGAGIVNHVRLWLALFITLLILILFFPVSTLLSSVTLPLVLLLLASGLVGYTLGDACLFQAFVHLGPQKTMLIMTSSPIFSMVLGAVFLDQPINPQTLPAIIFTLTGIAIVIYDPSRSSRVKVKPQASFTTYIAVLLAFLAAFGQAGGMALAKYPMDQLHETVYANFFRLAGGAFSITILNAALGVFWVHLKAIHSKNKEGLIILVIATLFGPILGVNLSLKAIELTTLAIASTIMQLTPIFLLPVSALLFKEKVTRYSLTGSIIAVAGAMWLTLAN